MNKQELTGALAETLRTNPGNAERLASQFILLGTKYRKKPDPQIERRTGGPESGKNRSSDQKSLRPIGIVIPPGRRCSRPIIAAFSG